MAAATLDTTPQRPHDRVGPDADGVLELRQLPEELAERLVQRLERGDFLNAFLSAAGLRQMAEDALERDALRLGEAQRLLFEGGRSRASRAVSRLIRAVDAARRAARAPKVRALRRSDARLECLLDALADAVMGGSAPTPQLIDDARALLRDLPAAHPFSAEAMRLPSCFRSFDQHPDDVERLVEMFAERWPDREREIAVVGLRTSGGYLAPLTAAALRAHGYRRATAVTVRPSRPLAPGKRRNLRALARRGGLAIVTDDPPSSGGSMAQVAASLERLGFPTDLVVLLFASIGATVPDPLRRNPKVVLPWDAWSLHRRLAPSAVASTLTRLWPSRRITDVTRLPLEESPGRGNHAARYRVTFEPNGDGAQDREDLYVRGVGLGYLGEHSTAVEQRMDGWLPGIHGIVDGLLYRRWLPEDSRVSGTATIAPRQYAAAVADYVATRRRQLPVEVDPAPRLAGQNPVWEVGSDIMSRAFARAWRPMRVAALDSLMRDVLRAERLSVIDGSMGPRNWFVDDDGESLVKIKADERAYSNRDLACSDAAFDAACAASWKGVDAERLRREFRRASGEWVDDERWLVYQLVAHWAARRDGLLDADAASRAGARALQSYFGRLYLYGVVRGAGPLCALDVDGVLETETLGFSSLSPAGALALRSLIAHGHRPVLATGRSIGEVAERCRAYGLQGGVAEYGAAVYETASDEVRVLVSQPAAAAVDRVRASLAGTTGVQVGSDHRHTVRAWSVDHRGRRQPLHQDVIEAALAAASPTPMRAIQGQGQTDFVPAEVDKATGLRALMSAIDGAEPLALAVGDTAEDLPMLRLARLGLAVANRSPALRKAGVRSVRRPYQAGLSLAVAELIGHRPGGCPRCAMTAPDKRRRVLLEVLAAQERGRAGLALHAARLVWMRRRNGSR